MAVTRSLVLMVLLVAMLAGCTDDAPDPVEECEDEALCDLDRFLQDHYCVQNDLPRVYAPDVPDQAGQTDPWAEGDWWEYSISLDGLTQPKSKLVYYDIQDNGAHYMVGTPTREEALTHAVLSTNPVIGRVHKTLYSPHESGSHADMFHFPLCDGSRWQDTFFDTPFTFTAQQTSIAIPGGTDPDGFRITGTSSDGSRVVHTYSPAVKWFTLIDLDRADGTEVDMRLEGAGSGATGTAFFLRGQKDEHVPIAATRTAASNVVERSDGGEGPYDSIGIRVDLERSGDGKVELRVVAPDGSVQEPCVGLRGSGVNGETACRAPPALFEVPYQAGEWRFELEVPLIGTTEASADIRVASIYDRSGQV